MIVNSRKLATAAAFLLGACALANAQTQTATCQRLEAELASLDRGNDDPDRAARIERAEDAVNRQQYQVDQMVARSRRIGCERGGFFSIFTATPPKCSSVNTQIRQARDILERMQNELERLHGGHVERAAQRRSLLIALGDNGCGPQYRSAAVRAQQGGFFERLFGGGPFFGPNDAGTFRTICVRTCDGYYFPISFATAPERFRDDEQSCQRMCPAAQVALYTYRNPGEEVVQAVSLNGRLYTELPTAFQYRQQYNSACSCRAPGQSWAEALRQSEDFTVERGDIVVTDERAKQLSQPRIGADGKPLKQTPQNAQQTQAPAGQVTNEDSATEPKKRKVRAVGPTFYPVR